MGLYKNKNCWFPLAGYQYVVKDSFYALEKIEKHKKSCFTENIALIHLMLNHFSHQFFLLKTIGIILHHIYIKNLITTKFKKKKMRSVQNTAAPKAL